MTNHFKIGPVCLTVDSPADFPWTAEVTVFRTEHLPDNRETHHYSLDFVTQFQPIWGNVRRQDAQMVVMEAGGTEYRIHLLPASGEPFAVTRRLDDTHSLILLDHRARNALKWDRNLLGLLALEHDCIRHDAFLLHASFVIHDGQAIVFSAPSGTGKSTQAALWAEYAGARIVNGDRTLLFRRDGQWLASGFPVCGSSTHCRNETAPLKALVCLEKAPVNRTFPLDALAAMKRVYSQAFINRWNPGDCRAVSDLIVDLAQRVPVYHYECTREPDAVAHLKEILSNRESR